MIRLPRRLWLTLALAAVAPRPARAHAILLASDPAHQARVPAGVRTVTCRFNARVDRARSRLTLIAAGGAQTVLKLTPGPDDTLTATATLAPGDMTLRWQVLALDGHITRGDVPFTVVAV